MTSKLIGNIETRKLNRFNGTTTISIPIEVLKNAEIGPEVKEARVGAFEGKHGKFIAILKLPDLINSV